VTPLPGRKQPSQSGSTYPRSAERWGLDHARPSVSLFAGDDIRMQHVLSTPLWLAASQRLHSFDALSYLGHTFAR